MPNRKQFKQDIDYIKKSLGLTYSDLSNKLGISTEKLRNIAYNRGSMNPKVSQKFYSLYKKELESKKDHQIATELVETYKETIQALKETIKTQKTTIKLLEEKMSKM